MISTITLDTYKQQIGSGDAFNLSDSFNGRVGDEQVPLVVQFKERGLAQQFQDGLVPFLSGFVGSLDENDQVTAETGEAVSYVGTSDDIVGLGRVKMNLPGTMFPQEGYFYGFLGLQNADGKRVTTFNIWFHVYNGNPDMFVNKAPFRTELQKVIDSFNDLLASSKGTFSASMNDWKQQVTALLTDLNGDYAKVQATVNLIQQQLTTLETQIKGDGLMTQNDLTSAMQTLHQQFNDSLKEVVDARQPAGAANAYPTIGDRMDDMPTGKEFNDLKNNLQNLVLSDRHRLTYKSVSVGLTPHAGVRQPTADFEFKHLANMGASATFVVMLNVNDKNDSNVQMPDDTIISKAISESTAAGVSVTMLKPHIGVSFMDWLDRSTYEPRDWDAFWVNWQNIMLHYAGICDANRIPILCLGCEQYNCTDASMMQKWGTLTAAIRSKYPNLKLTYAAVGDEYFNEQHAQIAQYLDFMGANFYPSYTYKLVQPGNAGGISIDELARAFYTANPGKLGAGNTRTYHEMVDFYQEKYNVPTFVTEIGAMPTDDGLAHLLSDNEPAVASDPTQQTGRFETPALAMEAFFNGLAQNPNIIGFAWWSVGYPFHFFNALGDSVAEDVMQKYVKGGLV